MSTEIERRFLLKDRLWRPNGVRPVELDQGRYFFGEDARGTIMFFLGFPEFRLYPMPVETESSSTQVPLLKVPLSIADGWGLSLKSINFRPCSGGWKADLPRGWMARIRSYNNERFVMDIKGPRIGTTRAEFGEYGLTAEEGRALLSAAPPASRLRKLRYSLELEGMEWVIDIYQGRLKKHLPTVEVEIPSDNTPLTIPDWVGEEITNRKTFNNARRNRTRHGKRNHRNSKYRKASSSGDKTCDRS